MALLRESVATKDETEAAREDARGGKDERGFGLARVKRKTTTEEDGGGVQPRWHENEA